MGNLEIVVVIMTAVECLVKRVVRDTVQRLAVYPAAVITVDNLAHQPEIRLDFFSSTTEHTHKIKIKDIGSIKTDAIYIKFRNPVTDHITDIILNIRIALVKFDEQIISTPVVIGKSIIVFVVSIEIDIAVPVKIWRMLPVFLDIFKGEKITSGMVEYTVKNNFDSFFVTDFYESCQILVGSETGIQFLVIGCFITMSDTFKKRTDVQGSAADCFNMVNPWKKSVQAMYRCTVVVLLRCSGKTKRINVIKNSFVVPTHVVIISFHIKLWGCR